MSTRSVTEIKKKKSNSQGFLSEWEGNTFVEVCKFGGVLQKIILILEAFPLRDIYWSDAEQWSGEKTHTL